MTPYPKRTRSISQKNIEYIQSLPCMVCGYRPPSDADHLRTRGAGGGDELSNLIPLCRDHHVMRHAKGLQWMVKEFGLPISWNDGSPRRIFVDNPKHLAQDVLGEE